MKPTNFACFLFCLVIGLTSCVSKKKFLDVQNQLEVANKDLGKCGEDLNDYMSRLSACEAARTQMQQTMQTRQDQINDLKSQITDLKKQRDQQLTQVEGLTELSQSTTRNIGETLRQLEKKDQYIQLLQGAKSRADSINLALAVNLKSVLAKGIADEDVEVKVDKTVVFVNLSDKMLYKSGSYEITDRANEVLGKVAQIIQSRPNLEVMVEGYTDNVPIKNECVKDNWDLSVLRSTSVARALQTVHNVDPNRLIAAGRGEYNALASNDTEEGRSINRRTRIIILPKLDQFYDLLDPNKVPD
jgi:chemotaxis protein MotB